MRDLPQFLAQYAGSFLVYVGVGGASALAEWAVFYTLLSRAGLDYVSASLGGFAVATLCNYLLSARLNFRRRERSAAAELLLVYAASGLAMAVNLAVMIGAIELLGIAALPAKMLGTAIAFLWNFAARQFLIFDRAPRWTLPIGRADSPVQEP